MDNILGILFDMDGVIVDSSEWNKSAFNDTLKYFGHSILTHDEYINTLGVNSYNQLKLIETYRGVVFDNINTMVDIKRYYARHYISKYCKPVNRISEILNFTSSIIKNGLVTNCSSDSCKLILCKMKIIDKFDIIINNSMVKNVKPHPEPYQTACNMIGISPNNILVIEDSDIGIISASKAGCNTLKVDNFSNLTLKLIKDIL